MQGPMPSALVPTALFALLVSTQAAAAAGEAPRLDLPVDCQIGTVCMVQNYLDTAPGPEARDYTCGSLAYDGHKGTDIRAATYLEMRKGVAVVAAAPGVVKGRRDGMRDVSIRKIGREAVKGREAGNGAVIDHGNGWVTQYSHLLKGSIVVQKGQRIEAGEKIGEIGLSGNTEFPHVEFAVRHDGKTIDPFTGLEIGSGCGEAAEGLWRDEVRQLLIYRAGGLLAAGFADKKPTLEGLLQGENRETKLSSKSPVLIFWTVAWGLRGGDRETIKITTPDGKVLAETNAALPRNKAQWFRFAGKRLRASNWPAGRYIGTYRVERQDGSATKTIINVRREVQIR